MKTLKQILEADDRSKYEKAKALYDNPGTPGEKEAAKAAMNRIKPQTSSRYLSTDYDRVLSDHGFKKSDAWKHPDWEFHTHESGAKVFVHKQSSNWHLHHKGSKIESRYADFLHNNLMKHGL